MQVVSCSSGLKELTLIPLMEWIRQLIQFGVTHNIIQRNLGRFQKVRTDRPDHGRTSHFDKTISFFPEFLLKNHLLCANYLGFNISGWIVLIKSEILIMTGMVWQVSSDKWKAPLESLRSKNHSPSSKYFWTAAMFPFSTATRKSSTASDNDAFRVSACVDLFGEKLLL